MLQTFQVCFGKKTCEQGSSFRKKLIQLYWIKQRFPEYAENGAYCVK